MVAEVRSQSADDLVDGVSAAQEDKYNFQHYFGNRLVSDLCLCQPRDAFHICEERKANMWTQFIVFPPLRDAFCGFLYYTLSSFHLHPLPKIM